jgi:hypothetical protein
MPTGSAGGPQSGLKRWPFMGRREPASSSPKANCARRSHSYLGVLIEAVDRRLRRRLGVSEYTQSSDCILRMQILRNTDYILLKDGTYLRPGAPIIDLHFWNQHIPIIPQAGPTLGWARRLNDGFERSLRELAHHLAARPDLDGVVAVRAIAALGTDARHDKVSRILSHFGFEIVPQRETPSATRQIRRYGENVLISLMVLAYNAISLRSDTLKRGRVLGYLSRRVLHDRYGAAAIRACGQPDLRQSHEVAQISVSASAEAANHVVPAVSAPRSTSSVCWP